MSEKRKLSLLQTTITMEDKFSLHDGDCSMASVLARPNMALLPAPIVEHVNVINDVGTI